MYLRARARACIGRRRRRPSLDEVVRQWVTTLVPPQAVSGVPEEQLCGADAGMRWQDYAVGRRWHHVAVARLIVCG